MVPVSLYLKGFMSFREEQTLHFEQDCISLLNGPNGVGKSTVFDAILFALYGSHRGGKQNALEVLHKPNGDAATVRFEFILNGVRYRAERSVSRSVNRRTGEAKAKPTRQLERFEEARERWEPVPGTQKDDDFNQWIEQNLLPLEAFTTSVMLMQGKAEILIERDPKFAELRFEVLRRIVGLEFYERLFEQVDGARQVARRDADDWQAKLDALTPVTDPDLAAKVQAIEAKNSELAAVESNVRSLQDQRDRAVAWKNLLEARGQLQKQWDAAEKLIAGASEIEQRGRELEELEKVQLPLSRLTNQRRACAEADGKIKHLTKQLQNHRAEVEELDRQIKEFDSATEAGNAAHEKRDVERADLDKKDREYRPALPWLRRIHDGRKSLPESRERCNTLTAQHLQVQQDLQALEQELQPLLFQVEETESKAAEAAQVVTRAEEALRVVQERADRLSYIDGKSECIYCGQLLTAKHLAQERTRIEADLEKRRLALESAGNSESSSQKALREAKARQKSASDRLQETRLNAQSIGRQVEQAGEAANRIQEEIRSSYDELSPRLKEKVSPKLPAEWLATIFPTSEDLQRANECLNHWQARVGEIDKESKAWKAEGSRLAKAKKRLEDDLATVREKLNGTAQALAVQQNAVTNAEEEALRAREELPTEWRVRADAMSEAEFQQIAQRRLHLQELDAAGQWKKLKDAHSSRESLRGNLQKLDEQQNQFADDERCLPEAVDPLLGAAREQVTCLHRERATLEEQRKQLEERRRQRHDAEQSFAAADRKRRLLTTLADLLGERQLQRHLLRQAEEQIIANSNAVLDRLSGGDWCLEPAPEEENTRGRALQLNARRTSTGEVFGLPFLSGSEKFRCAISLALGIGQFASRQHKPIESVIIDEGFGCLDRDNRRVMVDVLGQLRGQLRCILLISHQEEFAEAFPNGYRFALEEGTTRVSPMTA
jgi:DNA repair exonuclease SbcCD ATPase subunit